MYYEINVAKNGRHFFATAERSLNTLNETKRMWELFVQKFPPSEGYSIHVSQRSVTGTEVDFSKEI